MSRFIDGRPRLPSFDPPNTPAPSEGAAWKAIVFDGDTGKYAADTLLLAYDAAVDSGDTTLAKMLHSAIWRAGHRRLKQLVKSYQIEFNDPLIVLSRTEEYLEKAIKWKTDPEKNLPYKDYLTLRRGFYRFIKNRFIDALRIEHRVYTQDARTSARAKARGDLFMSLFQKAIDGRKLEAREYMRDEIIATVVDGLLTGDKTWAQIAVEAGLPSGDAARKRVQRLFRRIRTGSSK